MWRTILLFLPDTGKGRKGKKGAKGGDFSGSVLAKDYNPIVFIDHYLINIKIENLVEAFQANDSIVRVHRIHIAICYRDIQRKTDEIPTLQKLMDEKNKSIISMSGEHKKLDQRVKDHCRDKKL
ncbi:hypothetical protein S245_034047 [Arachis hypogaea]